MAQGPSDLGCWEGVRCLSGGLEAAHLPQGGMTDEPHLATTLLGDLGWYLTEGQPPCKARFQDYITSLLPVNDECLDMGCGEQKGLQAHLHAGSQPSNATTL